MTMTAFAVEIAPGIWARYLADMEMGTITVIQVIHTINGTAIRLGIEPISLTVQGHDIEGTIRAALA